MSASEALSQRIANDLPIEDHYKSIVDVIAIIITILETIGPMLEDCIEPEQETFGAGACRLAKECVQPGFIPMMRRARVRRAIIRDIGRREFRALGGPELVDSVLNNVAQTDPNALDLAHDELNCC